MTSGILVIIYQQFYTFFKWQHSDEEFSVVNKDVFRFCKDIEKLLAWCGFTSHSEQSMKIKGKAHVTNTYEVHWL